MTWLRRGVICTRKCKELKGKDILDFPFDEEIPQNKNLRSLWKINKSSATRILSSAFLVKHSAAAIRMHLLNSEHTVSYMQIAWNNWVLIDGNSNLHIHASHSNYIGWPVWGPNLRDIY